MNGSRSEVHCERCGIAIEAGQTECPRCHAAEGAARTSGDDLRLTPAQLAAVPHPKSVEESAGSWSRPTTPPAADRRPSDPPPAPAADRRPSNPPPAPARDAQELNHESATSPISTNPEDSLDDEPPETTDVSLRPPVLASQALLQALLPAEPGERIARRAVAALGLLGAATTVWLLGWMPIGAPILVGYLALTALAALPMAYFTRAAILLALSGAGLGIVCILMLHNQPSPRR